MRSEINKIALSSFLLTVFVLCFAVHLPAQTKKAFNPVKDDISSVLPPLAVILDSALAFDPALKASNLQVTINQGNVKTSRKQWTQNFGLQGNLGYGTFDYIYNNTLGGTNPASYVTRQSETQYGIGAFLRIPLYDMVNTRNQVRTAKAQVEQAQSLAEIQRNEVQERIITQYNNLVVKQRILRIKSRYLETSRINEQVAEKAFEKGVITIDEYSRVSEITTRTETDYEQARADFLTAYQTLEIMTGMKFNLTNEIPEKNEGN